MMTFSEVREYIFKNDYDAFIEWMKQNKDAWRDVSSWSEHFEHYGSVEEAIKDDEFFDDWSYEADWSTGYDWNEGRMAEANPATPNDVTFFTMYNKMSNAGFVDEAERYYDMPNRTSDEVIAQMKAMYNSIMGEAT